MRPFALLACTLLAAEGPKILEAPIRAHMAFLSDDLLEGRGTGQRGGDLAAKYLAAQLQALGVKPLNGDSYLQRVEVQGAKLRTKESGLAFNGPKSVLRPVWFEDVVGGSGSFRPDESFEAPVLFVGYGISAPERGWDDYKGVDCKGKLLVMLINDPKPTAAEPARFDGKGLTRYGRWTYKYDEAARRGAAGVLIIHDTEGAAYDWSVVRNGYDGEKFRAVGTTPGTPFQGWVSAGFAVKLFEAGGQDLAALQAAAERKDFRPVSLDLQAGAKVVSTIRNFPQFNVAGVIPGTDPVLAKEAVLYSAHWDHLGIQEGRIYPGAIDNGSAMGALLSLAQVSVAHPTRRSQIIFFPCGEEQGLLGARAYTRQPLWPLDRTVAALNFESLNWVGPSRDIEFLGGERSTLLQDARIVGKALGLKPMEGEVDTQGLFFRSDHAPFFEAGIPAVSPGFSLAGQRDYIHDPEASRTKARLLLSRYHQGSDRYDPNWDLRGMVQHSQFILELGRRVANAKGRPRLLTSR